MMRGRDSTIGPLLEPSWRLRSPPSLVAGCGSDSGLAMPRRASPGPTSAGDAVEVWVSADARATAETLTVTLTAIADAGYSVEFPPYPEAPQAGPDSNAPQGDAPQAFTLSGVRDADPVLREGNRIARRRTYEVEPFLDGAYEVPALALTYWEEREGDDEKATLETDAIAVTVTPILAPGEPPSPRDIAGPVALRDPPPWGLYLLLAALATALAGAGYWYWFHYTPPGPPAPPVPPHQRALEALDAIRRARLVEQGRYKVLHRGVGRASPLHGGAVSIARARAHHRRVSGGSSRTTRCLACRSSCCCAVSAALRPGEVRAGRADARADPRHLRHLRTLHHRLGSGPRAARFGPA